MRARMSALPPGGNGTMTLIDLPLCDHAGSLDTEIRSGRKTGNNKPAIIVIRLCRLIFPHREQHILQAKKVYLNSRVKRINSPSIIVYPKERTLAVHQRMSATGQKRTSAGSSQAIGCLAPATRAVIERR